MHCVNRIKWTDKVTFASSCLLVSSDVDDADHVFLYKQKSRPVCCLSTTELISLMPEQPTSRWKFLHC